MKGNISAYPEVAAQFPVNQADIQGMLMAFITGANPVAAPIILSPDNVEYTFTHIGLKDLVIPGAQQKKKTYKVIQQLLQEQPQTAPPQPPPPQPPGAPPPPPPQPTPIPSIAPNQDVDDLGIAGKTAKDWLISDEGMEAEAQNPQGFQNVELYAKACSQIQKAQQLQQALAQGAMQDSGPAADPGGLQQLGPHPNDMPPPPAPNSKGEPPNASQS
jgi:hypothetical protein